MFLENKVERFFFSWKKVKDSQELGPRRKKAFKDQILRKKGKKKKKIKRVKNYIL